ncbi:MAG: hypothetical protein IPK98_18355 [Chloracidobacterium sp.]|nr:hypothetical protein [Chloracidobacterium sp.]
MMFRRVSNPGTVSPTISGNISVTVPTTNFGNSVEHAGNTGGANGNLDALDDRLYQAMIRNGRLWTAQHYASVLPALGTLGPRQEMDPLV